MNFIDVVERAIHLRHQLHRQPEVAWQERKTAQTIRTLLDEYEISWKAMAETGTVAFLAPEKEGPGVALRADIDALEIQEETGRAHASAVPSMMHACGHDGHTATLMAAALWLKQHEGELKNPVSLIFQPAEEGGHGAKKMIEAGCLEGVDVIYGWHNWPGIPFGKAVCPDGIVMAGNGTFHITLHGKGGHASQPESCNDPVLAAAAVTMALQQIVARRVAPQESVVVSVTSIDAPSGLTTIPSTARLEGSIRVSDDITRHRVSRLIEEIAATTAAAHGVDAEVEFRPRYSATINHPQAAAETRNVLHTLLGKEWEDDTIALPLMASEDFSYYLQEIPGAYMLIGSNDGGEHHGIACHNSRYDFNDALIGPVSRIMMRLAGYRGKF